MKTLAIDVTSAQGSLVVCADCVVVAERHLESGDGFDHVLFPAIGDLLKEAGLRLSDIDCFAGASGPGSFTGVRVTLTTVKGLAEALHRPVVGVSNLRALSTFGGTLRRAVLLDARRGDIYGAVYGPDFEPITDEIVSKLEPWLAGLAEAPDEYIVQNPDLLHGRALPITTAPMYLAGAVALCAEADGRQGRWTDPAALNANYVRRSDAELFWKET